MNWTKNLKAVQCCFLFICGLSAYAQDFDTKLQGKISSTGSDVFGTHILNSTKIRGTIADAEGYFSIGVNLNDTLVFSAVQFKKQEIVVTNAILNSKLLQVFLEPSLTELDEVVLMPYNLTGELGADTENLNLDRMISARTENLPNAELLTPSKTERNLFTATNLNCNCNGVKLDPLMNYFSGRTKMLKQRLASDEKKEEHEKFRKYYEDEWYVSALKIPKAEIDNFIYYCELDTAFVSRVKANDQIKLIELMKTKSILFKKQNEVDE